MAGKRPMSLDIDPPILRVFIGAFVSHRVIQTRRLEEQLGTETITLTGHNVVEEILSYAHRRNVTKIIVGKPDHPVWRDVIFGPVLNDLVRCRGAIDV